MNLGPTELILILVIVLFLFGPSKLPGLGKSLGEAIRGFKKGVNEDPTSDAKNVSQQIHGGQDTKQDNKTEATTQNKDKTKQS